MNQFDGEKKTFKSHSCRKGVVNERCICMATRKLATASRFNEFHAGEIRTIPSLRADMQSSWIDFKSAIHDGLWFH